MLSLVGISGKKNAYSAQRVGSRSFHGRTTGTALCLFVHCAASVFWSKVCRGQVQSIGTSGGGPCLDKAAALYFLCLELTRMALRGTNETVQS